MENHGDSHLQAGEKRRVVLFPLPLQVGFSITIIHTNFNSPSSSNYPHFDFRSIPDGLLETQASTTDAIAFLTLLNVRCVLPFQDCLAELMSLQLPLCREPDRIPNTIACLITDAIWHFTQPVADNLKLPRIVLRTSNICSFIAFAALPLLCEKDSEAPVPEIPPLRVKDIPMIETQDPEDLYQLIKAMVKQIKASSGLIWNSFQELEEFQEIAWGLANSRLPFLWVVRPGLVHEAAATDDNQWLECLPKSVLEMLDGGSSKGHIVKWAPQQEVLAHASVGAFWTHNGWNSILESICEGVPMICQPCSGDQWVNARYVCDVWRIGLHLERKLERGEIERAIRRVILEVEGQRES
ncbi:hypothetical protein ACOSQ4_032768 [Xanthoceras sorbifolium]